MATEFYDLSVPAFLRGFAALDAILDKSRTWADEHGVAHDTLLTARLYDDMAPLTSQVQRASDAAKFAVARIGGIEAPSMPDTEASFAELKARIAATIAFIESVPRDRIDGQEDRAIEVKTAKRSFPFVGRPYLLGFALPNFYFHLTTAYAILRHNGVPIGKMDYLGGMG